MAGAKKRRPSRYITPDLEALRSMRDDGKQAQTDDPGGRTEHFFASRLDERGRFPRKLFFNASRARRELDRRLQAEHLEGLQKAPGGPGSVNWTPLGPSVIPHGQASGHPPVSGRVRSLAVGVGANRVYAGAANGGVWLSEDGGTSWRPLDDYATSPGTTSGLEADSLAVGALAVRWGTTQATDTIYVGTGEPLADDAYLGIGVKRSTSGGAPGTWTLEAAELAGRSFYRIAIDPDDPTIVLAATSVGLFRRPPGGSAASWPYIISSLPFGSATDVLIAGTGSAKRYYVAFFGGAVFSSPDLSSWTAVPGSGAVGRTILAAGESDPSVVYALGEGATLARLAGGSFEPVGGVPQALFFSRQGRYDMLLAVDPANADTIYLGGDTVKDGEWTLSLYKGTITGGAGNRRFPFKSANDVYLNGQGERASDRVPDDPTWIGRGIHSDGHTIAFAAAAGGGHDGSRVWIGCDGGVFASASSGARGSFVARNTGLAITEMEYLAQCPGTDAVLFAGAQDNGNLRSWGEEAWAESPPGDGGATLIDPNNQYRVMQQTTRADLSRSADGGISSAWEVVNFPPTTAKTASQESAAEAESKRTGFYAPLAASPAGALPTLAAFGTNRLWVTPDWGEHWVTLPTVSNPYAPATPDAAQDVLDGNPVTGIAFASGARIYASTAYGAWRFDFSGGSWTRTALPTSNLPSFPNFTDLATDAEGNVYAALGGNGSNHLWYFDGSSWRAAGPPPTTLDIPCHAVVVDPANTNVVFLGSDVGCWRGVKSGTTWSWTPFSQGLPEAAITDLGVHERTRLLRAATHGRGVWEYPLDASSGQEPEIYMRANSVDTGRLNGGGTRSPWIEGAPDPSRKNAVVYHWMSADIKVRRGSLASLPPLNSPVDFGDFAANIGDHRDSGNIETVDASSANRVFVEVHNRGLTPVPGAMVRVLLLATDAYAGLPPLPGGYAEKIKAGDASNWVSDSQWRFADPSSPYRTLPGPLDARVPQVVEFPLDITALGLPTGHDHVCAAAFITTAADPLDSTEPSLDVLTMQDRHAVHRNLHVVALGATPTTFVLGFANAGLRPRKSELIFDPGSFPGRLFLLLPRNLLEGVTLKGFEVAKRRGLGEVGEHLAAWGGGLRERLERRAELLGEADSQFEQLSALDFNSCLVADPGRRASLSGLRIPAGNAVWGAITLQAPADAIPGESHRLDFIQRTGRRMVGGSSYLVGVPKGPRHS